MWQNRSLITLLFAVVLQQCFDLPAASRPGSDLLLREHGSAEAGAKASVSTEEPDSAHAPHALSGNSSESSHGDFALHDEFEEHDGFALPGDKSSASSEPSHGASVHHGSSDALDQSLDHFAQHGNESSASEPSHGASVHHGSSDALDQSLDHFAQHGNESSTSEPSHGASVHHDSSDALDQSLDHFAQHGKESSDSESSHGASVNHGNGDSTGGLVARSGGVSWTIPTDDMASPSHDALAHHGNSSGGLAITSGGAFTSHENSSGGPAIASGTTSGGVGRGWKAAQTNLPLMKLAAAPRWVQDVAAGEVDKGIEGMMAEGPLGPELPFNEISEKQQKTYEDAIGSAAQHTFPTDLKVASEMAKFKGEKGKAVLGKRIGVIDKMLEGLVPDISKARMLAGGGRVIGIEQNLAQFRKRGQTVVGDMKGAKKLADTIVTHFKDATAAAISMDNFKEKANAATIKTLRDEADSMTFPG